MAEKSDAKIVWNKKKHRCMLYRNVVDVADEGLTPF